MTLTAQNQWDSPTPILPLPTLVPLGDQGLLVRYGDRLTDEANILAIRAARRLQAAQIDAVQEVVPNLISVLLRYDPQKTSFYALSGQVQLVLATGGEDQTAQQQSFTIEVTYGGESGPDLNKAAALCSMDQQEFIAAHQEDVLRVLATGFAPGFVYIGLHREELHIPRREQLHAPVPPGTILFAAGQTAITATPVPTGWHVIGRTQFTNFHPDKTPPTKLRAGDAIRFCERKKS